MPGSSDSTFNEGCPRRVPTVHYRKARMQLQGTLRPKIGMPNSVTSLISNGHLYLSGMWFGVAPRTDTKMTCVHGGHHVQNMITILGSAVDIIEDNMYEHSMSSMRSVTSIMNMVFI